ncbi:MAG TPA: TolC family protein [Pseudomonadales bacterium]|nr:TolC family protein [Pseudomonadales bacterium]
MRFFAIPDLLPPWVKLVPVLLLAAAMSACAVLSKDGGEAEVRSKAAKVAGVPADNAVTAETRAALRDRLLAQSLDSESAVRLALLNNPGLQSRFAELRISETEIVRAARPRNPGISLARLSQGGAHETDRTVVLDIMGLLTAPVRAPLAHAQFEAEKLAVEKYVLQLARDTRMAWVEAIAAQQRARYAGDVVTAAEAGRDLAVSLQQQGNISALDAAQEQAFHNEAIALQHRAQSDASSAREQLLRLLGLTQVDALILPDSLPALPEQARTLKHIEQQALAQRIDVRQAKQVLDNTARAQKLTNSTRFINVLDLGYQRNTFSGQPGQTGFEVSFELPLFDSGDSKKAEAEAIYQRALAQTAATAVQACSEARDAYQRYHTAWELARHYRDEVIPVQQKISNETLLRYNGMLLSTFDVLAQAKQQVASTESGMLALRDFWLADAQLDSALQ